MLTMAALNLCCACTAVRYADDCDTAASSAESRGSGAASCEPDKPSPSTALASATSPVWGPAWSRRPPGKVWCRYAIPSSVTAAMAVSRSWRPVGHAQIQTPRTCAHDSDPRWPFLGLKRNIYHRGIYPGFNISGAPRTVPGGRNHEGRRGRCCAARPPR